MCLNITKVPTQAFVAIPTNSRELGLFQRQYEFLECD